jgi:hypothetical protein
VPPFSPDLVVAEFTSILKAFRISTVTADRWGGAWVVERFRTYGITCEQCAKPKSDLYKDALGVLNSGQVELLDHPKAINQICALERRTARGGRDSIDHPPNAHDDLANAICGAMTGVAIQQGGAAGWLEFMRRLTVEAGGTDTDPIRPSGPDFGFSFATEPPSYLSAIDALRPDHPRDVNGILKDIRGRR